MKPVLVIGGGIAGVTAAVELAETGREVILVEKEPWLGGNVIRFNTYFPKLCPPSCGMEINFRRIRDNNRIRIITSAQVRSVEGEKGNFTVTVKNEPALVNDLCTACGECVDACPVSRPDTFNYNFGLTKAIFISNPLAFPNRYAIDPNYCEGESCARCAEVCSYGAIDLKAVGSEETLSVHSIIIATGWRSYDAALLDGLEYNNSADILTNVEFERLLVEASLQKEPLKRPSDGKPVKSISFVQCAGSRDRNHLPYCSAVCCSASLKHALNVSELNPDATVTIHYIDLRVTGRNEDFLRKVEEKENIRLVKGKVASIQQTGNGIAVEAEDIAAGRKYAVPADLVVLATGIVPNSDLPGILVNVDGFIEAGQVDGVFPVACARLPMDVSASVKDATSAAIKAINE
jgi:quinone-modifying oxidoreductase subunit QmoA